MAGIREVWCVGLCCWRIGGYLGEKARGRNPGSRSFRPQCMQPTGLVDTRPGLPGYSGCVGWEQCQTAAPSASGRNR